jgi:hypothetical protein
MADTAFKARLAALKDQWEQGANAPESMSAEAKQQCIDELSQVCADLGRLRDGLQTAAANEKAATTAVELIPQLMTRLKEIDADMLALGAVCRDGGNIYAFPSHWVNRKEYRVWVETAKGKIEKHKANIHQINELKHHTQVQIDQLENGDKYQITQIEATLANYLVTRKPFDGTLLVPKLESLMEEKGELIYKLRMLECDGYATGLCIGPDYVAAAR